MIIADLLYSRGISYSYEKQLVAPDGSFRYPDFTIDDPAQGKTIYWEHLGLLQNPDYERRWEAKHNWYASQGIVEVNPDNPEAASGQRLLLVTRDDKPGGISSAEIESLIDAVLGS